MGAPNFFVVGAARAGTTSLQYYLEQHPEIFVCPVKETNFFALADRSRLSASELGFPAPQDAAWVARLSCRAETWSEYESLFQDAGAAKAIGEVAPLYLYSPRAPNHIRERVPHAKIIVMLRQPVERAFSAIVKARLSDVEDPLSEFESLLHRERSDEMSGTGGDLHILRHGYYARQLERYFSAFGRESVSVSLFDEFERDSDAILRRMFEFLDVDPSLRIDTSTRYNKAGAVKNRLLETAIYKPRALKRMARRLLPVRVVGTLQRFQRRLIDWNVGAKTELPAESRRELTLRFYDDEIRDLESTLDRDLSHWRA